MTTIQWWKKRAQEQYDQVFDRMRKTSIRSRQDLSCNCDKEDSLKNAQDLSEQFQKQFIWHKLSSKKIQQFIENTGVTRKFLAAVNENQIPTRDSFFF